MFELLRTIHFFSSLIMIKHFHFHFPLKSQFIFRLTTPKYIFSSSFAENGKSIQSIEPNGNGFWNVKYEKRKKNKWKWILPLMNLSLIKIFLEWNLGRFDSIVKALRKNFICVLKKKWRRFYVVCISFSFNRNTKTK